MATRSIGTGGDFSTPQLWEDSLAAVLTEPEIGQLKNQEFVNASFVVEFSTHTTTVANFIRLECEAGASFKDNANVRTNALRYNAANGAAMRTTNINSPISVTGSIDHISFVGLQLQNTGSAYNNRAFRQGSASVSSDLLVKDCIMEVLAGAEPVAVFFGPASTPKIVNCALIQRNGAGHGLLGQTGGTLTAIACTVVAPSNNPSTGTGINRSYGVVIATDCAIFGFTTDAAALSASSDYNATSFSDAASGLPDPVPDHNVYSVTYDNSLFVQTSDAGGNQDFRLLANTLLQNAGIASADAPQDISGFVRSDPPDIGAWEAGAVTGAPGAGYFMKNRIDWALLDDDDSDLLWGWE